MFDKNNLIIDNVTKLYDKNHGIKSISTIIESGEITALIGPNGVGKTTLVKSIAGLLPITKGSILLSGIRTSDRSCRSKIGYMQNSLSFYDNISIYEVLDFICKIKYADKYHEQIDIYLNNYNLYEYRNSLIRELSIGMKNKLAIIMALIGTPQLILLDEPTNGVDTYGIMRLKEDLIKCSNKGCIIIVTSHVLDFLEKICSRYIFLKDGIIVHDTLFNDCKSELEHMYEQLYIN